MIINREQGQRMVVDLYQKYHALACFYCTGFGKGKAALDAIRTDQLDPNKRDWSALIIAHSESGRDTIWPEQIKQWAPEYLSCIGKQIQICCYQSLRSYIEYNFKWVIADEAHYITPNYYESIQKMKINGILLLTATEPEDFQKQAIIRQLSKGNELTIKLDMAVDNKILNDYRLRIWNVPLLQSEKSVYLQLCKRLQTAIQTRKDFMIKKAAGERMRFIYNLESKYKAAAWLRDKVRATGKRFVMHCGSIAMADRLSKYRYHSETDDQHYKMFLKGDIDELVAIKQIKEGQNIKRLESSIIVQCNSKQHNLIQEIGRNMRLDPDETAIIHALVAKDTVDETWLSNASKELNQQKISWHNIDYSKIEHYK